MSVVKASKRSINSVKVNKLESIESLMDRIVPQGNMILVKALILEEASQSKIIGADKVRESFFNYGRGVIVSVSSDVLGRGNFVPGMEVYFPPSVATSPNLPNFKIKSDANYFLVSEGSITYSVNPL